ncbi:MAG TPA: GNAT family N-acetyltransferase [bacterium]|nr:GNAT family N-acetyltransferase [bacterium]
MTLQILEHALFSDGKSYDLWWSLLSRMERYSFFHTPRWAELLANTLPDWRPCHLWFRFSDGTEAVLPLFAIHKQFGTSKLESLPWGTYGGLVSPDSLSWDHYRQAATEWLSLFRPVCHFLLSPADYARFRPSILADPTVKTQERCTHILPLNRPFEEIWSRRFQPRNRTNIRRAQAQGVRAEWSNSREAVLAMKQLYQRATHRWEGVETIPEQFFDTLVDLPGEEVRIWLAWKDDALLAGNLVFSGKGEAQYFAGASDERFTQFHGSKWLMSEIIRDACERGFSYFNFGGSGGLAGVEQFKRIFGGEAVPYASITWRHPIARWLSR